MVYASLAPRLFPKLAGNPRYEAIVRRMAFPQPGSCAAGSARLSRSRGRW